MSVGLHSAQLGVAARRGEIRDVGGILCTGPPRSDRPRPVRLCLGISGVKIGKLDTVVSQCFSKTTFDKWVAKITCVGDYEPGIAG